MKLHVALLLLAIISALALGFERWRNQQRLILVMPSQTGWRGVALLDR